MLALGRSSMLFDTILHLAGKGAAFQLIVTSAANSEYARGPEDFEALAKQVGSEFVCLRSQDEMGEVGRAVERLGIEEGITINWPYLLGAEFIRQFDPGFLLNLHFGRLPDYRGNATFNWLILQSEREGYADIHHVVEAVDAGNVVARHTIGLSDDTYVGDLLQEVERVTPALFEAAISHLRDDPSYVTVPNGGRGLRCYPRNDGDGRIDWTDDSKSIARLVRASSLPFPCAWCYYNNMVVRVVRAHASSWETPFLAEPGSILHYEDSGHVVVSCGTGVLTLEEVATENYRGTPNRILSRFRLRVS